MKTLIFILLFVLIAMPVYADTLTWVSNTDDTVGYKVYSRIDSGDYDVVVDVGNVAAFVLNDTMNERFFAVTAYDKARNESGYSGEIQYKVDKIPPSIPGKPVIKYSIEFE